MIGLDMIRPLNETGYSSSNWALTENQKPITSRSSGDYQRAMKKTAELEQNGIRTHISFTANRSNMADLFPGLPGLLHAAHHPAVI